MLLTALIAGTAAAQDPYGPTSTSVLSNTVVAATCELSVTSGEAGTAVTATVTNASAGSTVRILFGGTDVGRATAPAGGRSTLRIPFVVPDVPPGSYLVTAVGVDFTAVCSPGTGGLFEVLADAVARDAGGGGALPRTGIYVLLLLAIAAVLILVGRALIEESRRRRRQEEWDRRAAAAGVTSQAK